MISIDCTVNRIIFNSVMCNFCHGRGFRPDAPVHGDIDCLDRQNHQSNIPYHERRRCSSAPRLCRGCAEEPHECVCSRKTGPFRALLPVIDSLTGELRYPILRPKKSKQNNRTKCQHRRTQCTSSYNPSLSVLGSTIRLSKRK